MTDNSKLLSVDLINYYNLVAKVENWCEKIRKQFGDYINCKKGCSACCVHIAIFPVEAVNMAIALNKLPGNNIELIRKKALITGNNDYCPLLHENICMLYEARPIICRTHGFPVLFLQNGMYQVDVCHLNFKNNITLPKDAYINLDHLNKTLSIINRLFIANNPNLTASEHITVADAMSLKFD